MSRIPGKNTAPELSLRKALHGLGLRFRLHGKHLAGKPDLIFPKYRTVVFVHGCFWHRHDGCRVANMPKSNIPFWVEKFEKNVARDKKVADELTRNGWQVLVVWECELGTPTKVLQTAQLVAGQIRA
jgi:DNA mismatch endonuclease (patch repair protein)